MKSLIVFGLLFAYNGSVEATKGRGRGGGGGYGMGGGMHNYISEYIGRNFILVILNQINHQVMEVEGMAAVEEVYK